MENEALLETARRLREHLAPKDLDATLSQITAASVDLLPDVEYSSITVLHPDGELTTVAPTDPMIVRLDQEQYSPAGRPVLRRGHPRRPGGLFRSRRG